MEYQVELNNIKEQIERDELFLTDPIPQSTYPIHLDIGKTILDRYTIESHIKDGKSTTIYLAHDTIRSESVILKIFRATNDEQSNSEHPAVREFKIHNRIRDYRHIIKPYDLQYTPWGEGGIFILSMEFANGESFRKWLASHQEDWEERKTRGLTYFKQMCQAVDEVHRVGVLHLAITPNHFRFQGETLKLLDFETAIINPQNTIISEGNPTRAETARIPSGYISPEQLTGNTPMGLGIASDIYSLGCILHEILQPEGELPFLTQLGPSNSTQHGNISFDSNTVDPHQLAIINRCLEPDPRNRYQTPLDILADLDKKETDYPTLTDPTDDTTVESNLEKTTELWEQARHEYSDGNLNAAITICVEITKLCPQHTESINLTKTIQNRFQQADQFYAEIEKSLESQNLSESLHLLQEAINIYPNHPRGRLIQTRLEARAKRFKKAMTDGIESAHEHRWTSALTHFKTANQLNPECTSVTRAIEITTKVVELQHEIESHIAEGRPTKAIASARQLDKFIEGISLTTTPE